MDENRFESSLEERQEASRQLLNEYNLFAVISEAAIGSLHQGSLQTLQILPSSKLVQAPLKSIKQTIRRWVTAK